MFKRQFNPRVLRRKDQICGAKKRVGAGRKYSEVRKKRVQDHRLFLPREMLFSRIACNELSIEFRCQSFKIRDARSAFLKVAKYRDKPSKLFKSAIINAPVEMLPKRSVCRSFDGWINCRRN